MKQHKEKILINRLWDWLEIKFRDINLKLDHILFRLREDDSRIYQDTSEMKIIESDDEDFKGI